jgi:hypothetical protein
MLILNPRSVKFGAATWDDVTAVTIDRAAHKTVEEFGDVGPYAVLVDVPEQRVRIGVIQEVERDDVDSPRPGEAGTLRLYTSPTASDAGRRSISCEAVVLEVNHELSIKKGAIRTVTLAAVSPDGGADPVQVTDASDGGV